MRRLGYYSEMLPIVSSLELQIELSEEPLVVMTVGIPASGKSAVIDQLALRIASTTGQAIEATSVGRIHHRLTKLHAGKSLQDMLLRMVYQDVDRSLSEHGIALVDHTYIDTHERKIDIGRFRDMGAITIGGLFMDIAPGVAIQRNADRLVQVPAQHIGEMAVQLEANRPTWQEGFDWLVTVDDAGVQASIRDYQSS